MPIYGLPWKRLIMFDSIDMYTISLNFYYYIHKTELVVYSPLLGKDLLGFPNHLLLSVSQTKW